MATYNPATQTPTPINTLERALAHLLLTYKACNPAAEVQVLPNVNPEKLASVQVFQAEDNKFYLYGQVFIQVDSDWESSPVPVWENAFESSNVAVPARYLKV